MAWDKPRAEEIELFYAALPDDQRVRRVNMFGMPIARVDNASFGGVHGSGVMVRVPEAQRLELIAQGGKFWEPMPGRPRPDMVILPRTLTRDSKLLALWVRRAFEYALTLPPKGAKGSKASKRSGKKPGAKRRTPK